MDSALQFLTLDCARLIEQVPDGTGPNDPLPDGIGEGVLENLDMIDRILTLQKKATVDQRLDKIKQEIHAGGIITAAQKKDLSQRLAEVKKDIRR